MKEFYRNPNGFVEIYQTAVKKHDTYTYIHEGGMPAFHEGQDCGRLHSNFDAYKVPQFIRDEGEARVKEFRIWYAANRDFFERKEDIFYFRMFTRFGKSEILTKENYENSGIEIKENIELSELESIIDNLLFEASRFYVRSTASEQKMIRKFEKRTVLVYSKKEIDDNDTGLSEQELREFLKEYSDKFKMPVSNYLKEYYRIYFNPNLEFDGRLLEVLQFKKCTFCQTSTSSITE